MWFWLWKRRIEETAQDPQPPLQGIGGAKLLTTGPFSFNVLHMSGLAHPGIERVYTATYRAALVDRFLLG